MPSIVTETVRGIYLFIRRFTWELYKSIQFRVKEYDIELQARGWSLIKRVMLWAAITIVIGGTLLMILRIFGLLFLKAFEPIQDSVEQIQ